MGKQHLAPVVEHQRLRHRHRAKLSDGFLLLEYRHGVVQGMAGGERHHCRRRIKTKPDDHHVPLPESLGGVGQSLPDRQRGQTKRAGGREHEEDTSKND